MIRRSNRVHNCDECRINALSHRTRVAAGRVRVAATTAACESPTLIRPAATFSRWEKDYCRKGTYRASHFRRDTKPISPRRTKPIAARNEANPSRRTKPIRRAERSQWFLLIHCERGGYGMRATDADREWYSLSRRPSPGLRPPFPGGRWKENSRIPARNEANRRAERAKLAAPNEAKLVAPNEAVFDRKLWKRSRYPTLKEGLAAGRRVFEDLRSLAGRQA